MTYDSLMYAINRLKQKRMNAHGDYAEQDRINAKLTQLYELRALMIEQDQSVLEAK